jgi:hypothetical protein
MISAQILTERRHGRVVRTLVSQQARGVWKFRGKTFLWLHLSIQFEEMISLIVCRSAMHSMLCLAGGKVAVVAVVEAHAAGLLHPIRLAAALHLKLGVVPRRLHPQPGGVRPPCLGQNPKFLQDEENPLPPQDPTDAVVNLLLFHMAMVTRPV